MRTLFMTLLLVSLVRADMILPPGVPRPSRPHHLVPPTPDSPPPAPDALPPAPKPQPLTVTLQIGDNGAGSPRLVLPASLFAEEGRPVGNDASPFGTLVAALALSLAAVLAGFRIAGKKLPAPRLALGTSLTLLVLLGFSGCGTNVSTDPIITFADPTIGARSGQLEGTVLLQRGPDENAAMLIVPLAELQKITRP
jgi:hypothetical protein